MGAWTETVEAKARIIHAQMAAARALAESTGHDPDAVDGPYLALLGQLYREEYLFAQLVDDSDLVARFEGPAVAGKVPTINLVTTMCTTLRKQIQGVAKGIIGLTTDERVRWPAALDLRLSGMAPGSLVVGVSIQADEAQATLPEVSEPTLKAVKEAVQSISAIPRHVHEGGLDNEIYEHFPDPAVRDTVLVAAGELAPTRQSGIERLSLYPPDSSGGKPQPLTPSLRRVLRGVVSRAVRGTGSGRFEGVVRAIDLDARRFEIRGVADVGAIRCIYGEDYKKQAKGLLDARVAVTGEYEVQGRRPRLLQVSSMEVIGGGERLKTEDNAEQARMRAAIAPLIGVVHDESLQAENASRRIAEILAEKHARSQEAH